MAPSPNGDNGRAVTNGRFSAGNSFAVGNPHGQKVGRLRSVLLETVTPDDLKAVVVKLIELAKRGDISATKLLFDRCLGKSFVDRLPTPSPPTNGLPLTFEEKKARLTEIIHRLTTGGQTEQLEAERDVDGDAESLATATAAVVG